LKNTKTRAGFDFNLIGDKAIKRYYEYYFHERRHIMSYPVSKKSALGREDNLFRLLAKNELSVQAYERETQMPCRINLRQSFASAAQQFQVIDAITRGVIVPYRDGAAIIGQLCSNLVLSEYYRQLKQAQRYSVNLWDHEFQNLAGQEAIFETKKGSGIYCLDQRYYSEYFGFTQSEEADMDFLCV
jgi:CRISPR-associated endonuclease/helicase Cas3